ncbi:AraC family transcriptional regulator with amidase-like domain [Dinghuibacter silviterrae]|uniref:AraC family transcriptional regulator with amidase-like domain n=2 Tax=Dinghuibacter silviterrae TaxID=1539049 RepID=A0A4R8DP74_9BACT|nr:AraC family transcriptional regulator with amidase-like domain [Dinghuibacter silviterrae]
MTGPAHIFYESACYGGPVRSLFSTMFLDQVEVVSSSSLAFGQLTPYNRLDLEKGDLIFIPGLEGSLLLTEAFLESAKPFLAWLREQHARGVLVCSVCTGAFLLAESGLLDGLSCTTHWKYAERFTRRYPGIRLLANRLFVREEGIFTSAGVASGIDLALHLVQQLWGPYFAAQIAKEVVVYFRRAPDDPQFSVFIQYRNHIDNRIHLIQDRLAQSLDQKLTVEDLADVVSMSPRNLTRLFKKTTQITIGDYLEKLRVERAEQLISDGQTMQAAALHCGLKSTNQLRSLLRRHRGA